MFHGRGVLIKIAVGAVVAWSNLTINQANASLQPFLMPVGSLQTNSFSYADAISADGTTVAGKSGNTANHTEAYRWTIATGMIGLGDLPDGIFQSEADGVSGDGSVVVGYGTRANNTRAFRWSQSSGMTDLGTLPGGTIGSSDARAANTDGSVVVGYSDSSTTRQPFRWTQSGGMVSLSNGIAGSASAVTGDGQFVVGNVGSPSFQAFRWSQSTGLVTLGDLPGGATQSAANGISADGSVVVGFGTSGNGTEAFRWTALDGFQGLGDLPGGVFSSRANAVSADGSIIVGRSVTFASSSDSAFIWDNTHGMRRLQDVLQQEYGLDTNGWNLREATGISADGMTIVGNGSYLQENLAGWIVHIPEPSTLTMLLFGASLIQRRTRRP